MENGKKIKIVVWARGTERAGELCRDFDALQREGSDVAIIKGTPLALTRWMNDVLDSTPTCQREVWLHRVAETLRDELEYNDIIIEMDLMEKW
ncbi:MAG: hypothetical protein DRJ03_02890 [Chloroflexi bacterium]|nr:MAG: hypothetical protein DRJ03_02890 [Chloroflexota bacterium]